MSNRKEISPEQRAAWREETIRKAREDGYELAGEDPLKPMLCFIRSGPRPEPPPEAGASGCWLALAAIALIAILLLLTM